MKVLANCESTLTKEAGVLVCAAKLRGLTVDQLLQYESIKAISDGVYAQVNPEASDTKINLKP